MQRSLKLHWPEYLMEAALLGLFMISAAVFTTLFAYPASPLSRVVVGGALQRASIGSAMGLTAIALNYSPWGKQSGAHYNPAVTLTFWRLGKIASWDAVFYMLAQFIGGLSGVLLSLALLRDAFREPPVAYVATLPGPVGLWCAAVAEIIISFLLMSTVLFASNRPRLARFTPLFAGALVALFIIFEAPLSGMSMNPARSFASAAPAGLWSQLWIYFVAPVIGMLLAAEFRKRFYPGHTNACAKLHHENAKRCIFCGRGTAAAAVLILLCRVPLSAQIKNASVGPIAITVSDLDRSTAFYTGTLCFEKQGEESGHFDSFDNLTGIFGANVRIANLKLGSETVQLIQYITPEGRLYPADTHSNDDWFQHIAIVVRDMDAAYAELRHAGVRQISTEPQTLPEWNRNAAGIKAFYFRDPDNHPLELIYFPSGKGDPRWQQPSERLFLGIDHTAIAVEDTARSLAFYRDSLGFHVAGESLNYGAEQEHLNHVFGSRVRITSLRAASGPGVEFLEYLTPRGGRPIPIDTLADDLWHVHATLLVDDPAAVADRAHAAEQVRPLAPPGVTGFFVRDPDGHELLIRSR